MTKTMKNVISVLLSAVLIVVSVAVAAFAAQDGVVISGTAGDNVTWVLTTDGVLTVSGSGPIEDKTETEYYEDGTFSTSTLDSISMTFDEFFNQQTEGLSTSEKAQAHFNFVKEIVLEEGISKIPSNEFGSMYPTKVTLPASLETLGYDAFDLLYTEEIVVNSVKLNELNIHVPAYESDAEPYASLAAAKEDCIAKAAAQEAFEFDMLAFDVLYNYAYTKLLPDEAYWLDMSEEEKQEIYAIYNSHFGVNEAELEAFVPVALQKLNDLFETNYISFEDIFTVETDDEGNHNLVTDMNLQDMIDAKNNELYDNSRLTVKLLGAEYDSCIAYGWFTVTAPAGGKIEEDCKLSGASFNALDGATVPAEESENLCKFCGKDHSGSFIQKIVGFFHNIFYFFAHLFGKM